MVASYSVENDKRLERKLKAAASKVDDLRFALGEIARDWFKSNKAQFTLKGNGQYPSLSPRYEQRKRKLAGRSLPIMVGASLNGGESGRLRDSITGNPNKDSVLQVAKKSLVIGTKVPYGVFHQKGTLKMPMRKFIFVGPEAPKSASSEIKGRLSRWFQIIDADVKRQLERSGLDVKKGLGDV